MRYYRCAVTSLPPTAAITVVLDGRTLAAYNGAFVSRGHVYAPVRPFVTQFADRIWYEGAELVIASGSRTVRVRLAGALSGGIDRTYVPLAAVARALGVSARWERGRLLLSRPAALAVATPTPFSALSPQVAPRAVFTPMPVPTPRPVWSGSPLPRRTPLPAPAPTGA
jgi:hypothetical protein